MAWNNTKLQVLRLGKNSEIKENTSYFSPNFANLVEEVDVVRDLGIQIDNNISYNNHRSATLKKVVKKIGWIKRTFSNRTVPFLKTSWNSLL